MTTTADVETIIYEADHLVDLFKLQRAEAILHMALHQDTVLFEFPTIEFPVKYDTFNHIRNHIGEVYGARLIVPPQGRENGRFMVETKFVSDELTDHAISDGMTIGDVKYKAILTKYNQEELPNMVRLHVTSVPVEDVDSLKNKLCTSLGYYGKVCQILLLRQAGFFEGAITVLLDTTTKHGVYKALQRRLYMSAWDIYLPATFKGGPPICFHCQQSGHLKRDCPVLAALKCYQCGGNGHIARHCRFKNIPKMNKTKRTF